MLMESIIAAVPTAMMLAVHDYVVRMSYHTHIFILTKYFFNIIDILVIILSTSSKISGCGWLIPNDQDNVLQCEDGTFCDGTSKGWSCCNGHGGRARCPKNTPMMCLEKRCAGGTDYCCSTDCKDAGGPRVCEA